MLFWILLIALIVVVIGAIIYGSSGYGDLEDGIISGLCTLMIGGVLAVVVLGVSYVFARDEVQAGDGELVSSETFNLGQVSDGTYLSTDVKDVDGESVRVINFVRLDESGAFTVDSADVNETYTYQDAPAGTATGEVRKYEVRMDWFSPWVFTSSTVYEFHIPESSVVREVRTAP